MDTIKVYGAGWCEDTQATRGYLDRVGVKYDYLDVDADPVAKNFVVQHNGKQRTPTVVIGDQILVEPENADLEIALRRAGAQ